MHYRSRRLEALFGAPLDTVTYADISALVNNPEAAEAEDLDYKRELLAADTKGKEELAKDVAAFANHIGGVLVVGLADTQGIPSKVTDSDVTDAHQRHLQQVVASNTAPPVRFDLRAVHNPTNPGRGFLILAIPRSPQGPHAVTAPPTKPTQIALRYPRRGASKTEWLTETDVATAYYRRFNAFVDRSQRLAAVESELLQSLPESNVAHLLVSLSPEVPGDMQITQNSFSTYKTELLTTAWLLGKDSAPLTDVRIGSRRLITHGGRADGPWYCHSELHCDGSGTWAMRLGHHVSTVDMTEFAWAEPDTVIYGLLSALHLLGSHARDRSGATSTVLVKAALVEAPHAHPAGPLKPNLHPLLPFRIDGYNRLLGMRASLSTQFCEYSHSEGAALLDDLADSGPALVRAAAPLANELFQSFGIPEASPITRDGTIRSSAWSADLKTSILRWSQAHKVSVVGE
ncbi:helix-turn-helix domain-containing protein [Streptomyces sp. NPDC091383]|uniref:AlbA family DNA-binding domain-containing protein n=1 Tax=Streptomyces sp. NPDC091383 TaxID=3365996 RepID=UPI003817E026